MTSEMLGAEWAAGFPGDFGTWLRLETSPAVNRLYLHSAPVALHKPPSSGPQFLLLSREGLNSKAKLALPGVRDLVMDVGACGAPCVGAEMGLGLVSRLPISRVVSVYGFCRFSKSP